MWSRDETRSAGRSGQERTEAPDAESRANTDGVARLGSTVRIKGTLTGSEDLKIDGRVEGRIELPEHTLTIEPNAIIEADIVAKAVIVFGSVVGAVTAREKLEIRRSGSIAGQVACAQLSIHEGAHMQGKVEMGGRAARSDGSRPADSRRQLAPAV